MDINNWQSSLGQNLGRNFDAFKTKINMWNQAINLYASTSPGGASKDFDLPLATRLLAISVYGNNFLETVLPALVMPVNPKQFRVEHKKKSSYRYTLGGFVLNHWHPDLTTITANGYIPSFQGKSKPLSLSFWYFMALLQLYRKCGEVDTTTIAPPVPAVLPMDSIMDSQQPALPPDLPAAEGEPPMPSEMETSPTTTVNLIAQQNSLRNAELVLWYNTDVYIGIFTNFTIEEDEEQPNTLLYNFTFSARTYRNVIGDTIPIADIVRGTIDTVIGISALKGTFAGPGSSLNFGPAGKIFK